MDLTTYALLKQQIGNMSSFTEEDAAKLNKVIQDVEELSGQTVNKEEFAEMLKSLVEANDNDKIDTIEEIANWISGEESRLSDKANTTDLAQVAFSGDYNDLINIPQQTSQIQADWSQTDETALDYIKNKPQQITEQDVTNWGFTKNTGTYIKPADGIPASDLASAVQTSLGKADTALQEHQSLSGYATESWVQDQGYLTQHQDISGKADKIPRIAKASTDTTAEIEPNKLYVFPEMASLTITLAAPSDNSIVNEYHFIFTSGATATVLTIPATVLQPDGFTVEANMHYEVSILEGAMTAQGWAVTV